MLGRSSLSLATFALTLTFAAGLAHAKPKVAILGLEVIDDGGIDEQVTRAAQVLTRALRQEVKRQDGEYDLAPNAEKGLLEVKLLSDCSDEARGCMSAIGRGLGAEALVYGKLERRQDGYQVSLSLLDTASEQMKKTTSALIPRADLEGGAAGGWARTLYGQLTGVPATGDIEITTNADRGTVYVDGAVATTLSNGAARVPGVEAGVHTVVIDAPGYDRYEAEVAVDAGGTETLSVSLSTQRDPGGEDDGGGNGWRYAFLGGVLLTGGMATGWAYNGLRVRGDLQDDKDAAFRALEMADSEDAEMVIYEMATNYSDDAVIQGETVVSMGDACSAADKYRAASGTGLAPQTRSALDDYIDQCDEGERAALLTNVFVGATVVSAALTAYFGYKGFFADDSREGRERGPSVRFTPTLSPGGGGVGLAIEF